MRAVVIRGPGGPDVVGLDRIPIPAVGPGQVKVDVRAASLNFRDIRARRFASAGSQFPLVPGSDFAGVVAEVGDGVDTVSAGERVVGLSLCGAHAEQVITPAELVAPLPAAVGFAAAAALPTAGLTALFLIDLAGVRAGSTVVTFAAAGGLGCYLGNLLAATGARSIGVTSTEDKAAVARAAGHRDVVAHRLRDPVGAVLELTGGRGADVVFDAVAGPAFASRFSMLCGGGSLVVCGRAAGEPNLTDAQQALFGDRRNLAVRDFYLASHLAQHLHQFRAKIAQLTDGLAAGTLRVPLTEVPIGDAREAHRQMETGRSTGKIVLLL